jgi:hypothetical protein
VFVTGESSWPSDKFPYATVAYDSSTGATLWVADHDGLEGIARSIAASPDGSKVFVTGMSVGPQGGWEYATVAYDASTGATLWVKLYNGPGNSDDQAFSIAASPDGSKVFVTGLSVPDYATVAYEASTGAMLWLKRYPGNLGNIGSSVTTSPDGSKVFVTGENYGGATGYDYATVAYEASTGGRLWFKRYNDPWNGKDSASAILASPDGSKVFVTGGSTRSGTGFDYVTVAYATS